MKIEELVGSLQTYEYSLPPVKKAKGMAFKTTKRRVSSNEDSDNEEEDELTMIANRINKLMKTNKFIEGLRETPSEAEPEEDEKMDHRGHRCCECSSFGHMIILHLRKLSILQKETYLHVIIVGWWDIAHIVEHTLATARELADLLISINTLSKHYEILYIILTKYKPRAIYL
jgi:hypothetical protein